MVAAARQLVSRFYRSDLHGIPRRISWGTTLGSLPAGACSLIQEHRTPVASVAVTLGCLEEVTGTDSWPDRYTDLLAALNENHGGSWFLLTETAPATAALSRPDWVELAHRHARSVDGREPETAPADLDEAARVLRRALAQAGERALMGVIRPAPVLD